MSQHSKKMSIHCEALLPEIMASAIPVKLQKFWCKPFTVKPDASVLYTHQLLTIRCDILLPVTLHNNQLRVSPHHAHLPHHCPISIVA